MSIQIENIVIDSGLIGMHNACTHITICASEPTTYALATVGAGTTQLLGYASLGASNVFSSPVSSSTSLRTVNSTSVSSQGTITTTGTAAWWAAVDETGSSLYAHSSLSAAQVVTAGQTFTLGAFHIEI